MSLGFTENSCTDDENVKEKVMNELKSSFRPEFLNRVDDIILFNKLTKEEICEIAEKMLAQLDSRLHDLNISIEFDKSAVDEVADSGFDPVYGARPLRRSIQSRIEDVLSEKILDGSVKNGDKVRCTYSDGQFKFETV